ncbi:MAG: GGDEF domain-containing protein [Treponema sp.]|nr:GGDEF domain-containing protein [Treponema sp.]
MKKKTDKSNLPSNRKIKIGLLLDYIVTEYSEFLAESVRQCCKRLDLECLVFQIGSLQNHFGDFEYQNMASTAFLKENNVDGLIFNSATLTHNVDFKTYTSYLNSYSPLPIVNIGNEITGIPSVVVDYEEAFTALLDHVIQDVMSRKILLLSVDSQSEEVLFREKLFWQTIQKNRLPMSSVTVIKTYYSYESAKQELTKYIEEKKLQLQQNGRQSFEVKDYFNFDAIIAFNDDMAVAASDFCKELKLNVPEDIVITGFDDLRKARYSEPSLSTINQMIPQMGALAVSTLHKMISGEKVPLLQVIDGKAVLRHSTGASAFFSKVCNQKSIEIDRASLSILSESNPVSQRWYNKRSQVYRVAQLYMDIKNDFVDDDDVINKIVDNLLSLDLQFSSVVVYRDPIECSEVFDYFHLPHEAVLLCFNDKVRENNYRAKKMEAQKGEDIVVFDPNDSLLPEPYNYYFDSDSSKAVVILSLFAGKYQYGYIMLEMSDCDYAVYDLLRRSISNMLFTLHTIKVGQNDKKIYTEQYATLDKIAHTDELTGILNRRGLFDFGGKTLDLSKSMGQKGLLVFCDMDGLKKINDNFGHESGDKAIIAEAGILKSSFRATDVVARIGGDEFVVISPGLNPEIFARINEKVQEKCIRWTEDTNSLFVLSVSLGYVEYPLDGSYDLSVLMSAADSLLYQEKRRKKGLL